MDPKGNHLLSIANRNRNRRLVGRRPCQDNGYQSDDENETEVNQQESHHDPNEVDQDYLVVGNYVDESIRSRIENGEYVDFSRLLPRDWLMLEEDNRMEIVNHNGKTYFVPASDSDPSGITNFSRWEQAFRVFSNIYTR